MSVGHDVIIAGAGPVGLFLAGELRRGGASVLVLERAADPSSAMKRLPFGLRGLTASSIDALAGRGLLEAVATPAAAAGAHWSGQKRRSGGHFAGIQFHLDRVDRSAWPACGDDRPDPPLAVELELLERVLAADAEAIGVEIRRGVAVEGVQQAADRVAALTQGEWHEAAWLVGCDGGRSAVRRAAGFAFSGTEPEFTGYSAEVELADPAALPTGRHAGPRGFYTYAPPGVLAMAEFDGGAQHRAALTREHVEAALRRVSGLDIAVTALRHASTWTDRAYMASAYRRGRVLLAGDAAHVHSPLGGQGLNLGVGDAADLGARLAAIIRGDTPADLLDGYERARRPTAARVLDWSRAQVALMRPDPGSRALAEVMRDLIATRAGATYIAGRVWGMEDAG